MTQKVEVFYIIILCTSLLNTCPASLLSFMDCTFIYHVPRSLFALNKNDGMSEIGNRLSFLNNIALLHIHAENMTFIFAHKHQKEQPLNLAVFLTPRNTHDSSCRLRFPTCLPCNHLS